MINGLCHSGNFGSLGNFSVLGWMGMLLNLLAWVGLLAGLALLVIWAMQRGLVRAAIEALPVGWAAGHGQNTAGEQNTAKEILQAQYARGEITREQYELRKTDIG